MVRHAVWCVSILGGALMSALPAGAAEPDVPAIQVEPARLKLSPDSGSGSFSITNVGSSAIYPRLESFVWVGGAGGLDRLIRTSDLTFEPEQVLLKPGQSVSISVRMAVFSASDVERSYRIGIDALAAGDPQSSLQRISLPVFLQPLSARPTPVLSPAILNGRTLQLVVANHGNAHFLARSLRVRGESRDREVFDVDLGGWTVLAGSSRALEFEIPAGPCEKLRVITLELEADDLTASAQLDAGRLRCRAQ